MRFTIRDLLWLTVVVALGVAWWVSYRRQAAQLDGLASGLLSQESINLVLKSGLEAERSPPFAGLPAPPAPNLPTD